MVRSDYTPLTPPRYRGREGRGEGSSEDSEVRLYVTWPPLRVEDRRRKRGGRVWLNQYRTAYTYSVNREAA